MIVHPQPHNYYAGISGGIAYGGLFAPDCALDPGTTVDLVIMPPGSSSIFKAQGSVRWIRRDDIATTELPAGCGISWQTTNPKDVAVVRKELAKGSKRKHRY